MNEEAFEAKLSNYKVNLVVNMLNRERIDDEEVKEGQGNFSDLVTALLAD